MTNWREIPSLSALRAFEAMARLGGFSAAARELNVTHAAIAQHVRALEAELDQALVVREGRGMGLTQAGRILADALGEGFGAIATGVRTLRNERADRPLQVALTPSFAENWLMPRIGAFWQRHPDIGVALVPGFEQVDLKRDGFDLAIRYGRGTWDGVRSEKLVDAENLIVSTPAYADTLGGRDMDHIVRAHWLASSGFAEPHHWLDTEGIDISPAKLTEFPTNAMVLAATRAGHGLSVQGRALVLRDLQEGSLEVLYRGKADTLGYYLLTLPQAASPKLSAFIDWLRAQD